MTTSSATRSIEIDAPVQEVFDFVSNPKKLLEEAFPLNRRVTVSDIVTTPEGIVTGFKWTTRFALLPLAFNASCTRLEQIPNERIVDKYSTGDLSTYVFEPSGDGTRLTSTTEISRRIPLLDKLEVLVFMLSKRMDHALGQQLALIKQLVEAPREETPHAQPEPDSAASDASTRL